MANEGIHAIVYPDGVVSQSAEGIMFSCEDPVWILIPTQTCLQDLKILILMNLGQLGRKEITRLLYRMPIAVANSFVYQKMQIRSDTNVLMMFSYHHGIANVFAVELCVQLEDVGASSSTSNHVEPGRGFNINGGTRMPSNLRASSPSPSFSIDNGEDEEFIPETQLPVVEPNLAIASIAAPLRHVREEAAHYSTINPEGMQSGSMEDGPSSYPVSGKLELKIGLKINNRDIAMLAVKNYNIRRSAEFKVVESDKSRYVCKCKQFGAQCQWSIRVAKIKSSRF
ncbi:hypothetical protein PIB30_056642 [Stylosanthes scabra]|uniref:Transposase MuDR plant domain-containing protein n=1 Tax=Stylosanthes scabra TaxID=79078 RepID=A0ABU6RJT2_9FABA|nr:hypothetical protein [Stylosanthes scabra]